MLPPDLEDLLKRVRFRDPAAARARISELATDPADLLALERLAPRLEESLSACPDCDRAINNLNRFVHASGSRRQIFQVFSEHPAALDSLIQVISASQYLADVLVRNPEYFEFLTHRTRLQTPKTAETMRDELRATCSAFSFIEARLDATRRFRRREFLRIGAGDLHGILDFRETTRQLSLLADAVVAHCLEIISEGDKATGLMVLALGKLGGGELNYSSDIDLIFVTEREDRIEAATLLAQSLTRVLSEVSSEGFLYRVDLLLRPYGASGAMVVSSGRFEKYLRAEAHPAERQAMLKARVIAGEKGPGLRLLERAGPLLRIDAGSPRRQVRELKDRIERQLRTRGQEGDHVKLARGGIRDIEFIAQALQLEHAGARPEILTSNTQGALEKLSRAGLLASRDAADLHESYLFLRTIEHRLQLMDNQQVHRLPRNPSDLKRLARTMGFSGNHEVDEFRESYEARVRKVRAIFERILP